MFVARPTLGIQANPDADIVAAAVKTAMDWGRSQYRKAKSFNLLNVVHTDYHGNKSPVKTGYARVEVIYFSSKREGRYQIQ